MRTVNAVIARKTIDFCSDLGIDCTVVDEHLSMLVRLSGDGRTHEFRCGNKGLGGAGHWKKLYSVLEKECLKLKTCPAPTGDPGRSSAPPSRDDAGWA